MTWFLDEKVQKQIPDFNINHLKQINEFHYFKEYNEHYDLINCIHLHIPYESATHKADIHLKFTNVSSVQIKDLELTNDSSLFLNIQLLDRGWEYLNYFVEDYEEQYFSFYCETIQVIQVVSNESG
ncbi:hypothetical protein HF326_06905 [Bacillus altitudinis MN12]|uniref:Uncharacterized protein n=1 Tax=Bacillus aerius TaxID=293388 RepID=A0ABR6B3I6_9BACI|nr:MULTISPECIES: hypothetical protein [Bacillus]KML18259.1 hypothetical protein VL09_05710 [Bacillus stratosphericus]QAR51288.1 hypothetical protein BAE_00140 [Bacillus aerophilus]CVM20962.1 Uncharacterised protein [Streptococcus pneumoniae]AKC66755.1 hypothetical protein VT48_12115 [Bacillus altitudinis]ALM28551.1 hypothetical protein AKO65_11250 [Bacillus altitudinis]